MANSPPISLSIAVVCYRPDQQELKQLYGSILESVSQLKENTQLHPVSIYLVDNSESKPVDLAVLDEFQEQAGSLGISLHLIYGHGNIGYGRAHNLVLQRLDSDFHLMLNSDVVLDHQCLVEGITFFARHEAAVMASPMAFHKNGLRQYLCKRYPSVLTLLVRGFSPSTLQSAFEKRLARYEFRELVSEQPSVASDPGVPIISGCFMLCRTQVLAAINGFDSRYFLYFEDFDLSLRMGGQGKIAYVPSMKIIHGGGNAAKKGLKHILMFARSGIRFFNSHGWRWLKQ